MDGTETWFRVYVEVEYTIRYHSYNPDWDHTRPTTGDHEGDNPLYVQHAGDEHENFYTYLGPYNSLAALEREYDKFVAHYESHPESYRDLRIERGMIEKAHWEEV
jgi:hypothetical protein